MTHTTTDMGEPDLVTLAALWSARLGRTLHPGQVDVMLNDLDSLRVWSLPDDGTLSAPLVEVEDDALMEVRQVMDSLADLCKLNPFVGDDEDPQPSDVISFEAIRPAPRFAVGLCQCNRCWRMVRAADLSRGWCRSCHAELGLDF